MQLRFLEKRWPWIVAAGIVVAVVASTFVEIQWSPDWDTRPPGTVEDVSALRDDRDLNVLFILVDTLRAERLGSYGYERDTSPTLDRLAASGVRFGRHLSQSSWTKASMASLWTGLYPQRTGITRYDDVLPDEARMAAELLRDAGFQTVGLWRNGWVAPTFGFDQGFEVYQRPVPRPLPPNARRENPTLGPKGSDEGLLIAAREFLRVSGSKRWFLYLHLMDLHEYIYDTESALFGSSYSDIYDNSIRWTDRTLEILLATIADMGYLDDTLVVITSDHGEAFLERGFEGHARRVYRETTEIPLFISFPFRLPEGIVVEARTQNVDTWPTILDLIGIDPPEGIDGRSRLPEILAAAEGRTVDRGSETSVSALDMHWGRQGMDPLLTVAVLKDGLRYVRVEQLGDVGPLEQLFDSNTDPAELRDRAEVDPETLARMRAIADDYYGKAPTWGEAPTREIDELELNLLRALGYAIE